MKCNNVNNIIVWECAIINNIMKLHFNCFTLTLKILTTQIYHDILTGAHVLPNSCNNLLNLCLIDLLDIFYGLLPKIPATDQGLWAGFHYIRFN